MKTRSTKGFGLIEFLIVVAVILIVAALVMPSIFDSRYEKSFETYIGIKPDSSWKYDKAAWYAVEPLVNAKLKELGEAQLEACAEKNRIENLPTEPTADAAKKRLEEINTARQTCENAARIVREATAGVNNFRFQEQ